MRHNASTGLAT